MRTKNTVVTVFGGTGLIGQQIVRELAACGMTIKIATRSVQKADALRVCGAVGQIVPFPYDPEDPDSIAAAVQGSSLVVNCVGILYERGRSTFRQAHVELPGHIASACRLYQVSRFLHISALGAERGRSRYARSKKKGEEAVRSLFPHVTIFRPSVVFGPEDDFFNRLARLCKLPFIPLIGGGKTRFQPVYVGDIADAARAVLTYDGLVLNDPAGKTYELGGPEVLTFKELFERTLHVIGKRKIFFSVPWGLAAVQGWLLGWLPSPPLTVDQVTSLKTDNIVTADTEVTRGQEPLANNNDLSAFGIMPTCLDLVLPVYIGRYRAGK